MLKICASLKFQHVRSMYRKMVGILLFRWNYACAQTATRPHDVIKISGYFPKPQGASNTLRPCTSGVSTQHSEHSRTIGIIPGLARDFKAERGFCCACISCGVELSKLDTAICFQRKPRAGTIPRPSGLHKCLSETSGDSIYSFLSHCPVCLYLSCFFFWGHTFIWIPCTSIRIIVGCWMTLFLL